MATRSLLRCRKYINVFFRSCNTQDGRPSMFTKEKLTADNENFRRAHEESAPAFLRAFTRKSSRSLELYKFNPEHFSMEKFRAWKARSMREAEIASQFYMEERHTILGNDLAAATFIVFRGGKAKFVGQENWYQIDEKTKKCPGLPTKFVKNWFLEAIDASNTEIRYEGLANFVDLPYLKWLSFANCPHVDAWFVDRITGEFGDSLEYLDLSGCEGMNENALSALYRCSNLKELVLKDVDDSKSFQFGCLFLEEAIPGLTITGVNFDVNFETT